MYFHTFAVLALRYSLAIVVVWFGLHEVFSPSDWVVFAPHFIGDGTFAMTLVVIHGVILSLAGLALITGVMTRVAAALLSLMLLEIIVNLVTAEGLSDIAIRDIGLLGMAVSLAMAGGRSVLMRRPDAGQV